MISSTQFEGLHSNPSLKFKLKEKLEKISDPVLELQSKLETLMQNKLFA